MVEQRIRAGSAWNAPSARGTLTERQDFHTKGSLFRSNCFDDAQRRHFALLYHPAISFRRGTTWRETVLLEVEPRVSGGSIRHEDPPAVLGVAEQRAGVIRTKTASHQEGHFGPHARVAFSAKWLTAEDRLSVHGRRSPRHHASRVTCRKRTYYNVHPDSHRRDSTLAPAVIAQELRICPQSNLLAVG